jgi:signal transduction histidine kinase
MLNFWNRFYVKISLVFLILIIFLAALHTRISSRVFNRQRDEIDQRANVMLAADMAREIEPYLGSGKPDDGVGSAIHYMMVLNPLIEIYLLSSDGAILEYFADSESPVVSDRVDLNPVNLLLQGNDVFPIYGDDPRRPDHPSTFSVAPLDATGEPDGYLYIVLQSSLYDSARIEIEGSYFRAALRESLLLTLPFVAILGIVLFFFLTMRLQRLTRIVREFGAGAYDIRAEFVSNDEIGELAGSFNTMASTIERSVARIEQVEGNRRELVANISHDIRTPLAAMSGYTETLIDKDATLSAKERKQYLEISLKSVDSIRSLVDDLFALSKLEAKDHTLELEEFSLSDLCQDVVMLLGPMAENAQVILVLVPPEELFFVSGDISMLERVLVNLVENALRYAPEGTQVVLSLERTGLFARVSVSDKGAGLSQDQSDHVFERFYTGDLSRSSGHSGLGLAIARRIVELHGGLIGVNSRLGSGSTFYFEIPSLQR